jgi:hypothetical protein
MVEDGRVARADPVRLADCRCPVEQRPLEAWGSAHVTEEAWPARER